MTRRHIALAVVALCGALGLAACTATPEDGPSPTSPTGRAAAAATSPTTTAPAAATSAPVATGSDQAWADQMMQTWFAVEGARSIRGFTGPFSFIQAWRRGAPGEVVLTVDPRITDSDDVYKENAGPANDLNIIAAVMMEQVMGREPSLQKVTAATSDGARTETVTRAQAEARRADQPAGLP